MDLVSSFSKFDCIDGESVGEKEREGERGEEEGRGDKG